MKYEVKKHCEAWLPRRELVQILVAAGVVPVEKRDRGLLSTGFVPSLRIAEESGESYLVVGWQETEAVDDTVGKP